MITENLSTLKIHKLTQAQYNKALADRNIDENAMYLTPDEEVDYATKDYVDSKHSKIVVELASSGWVDNYQTVNANGVTVDNIVIVSPDPTSTSYQEYTDCGIYCVSQTAGKLTFRCDTTPNTNIAVNIVVLT